MRNGLCPTLLTEAHNLMNFSNVSKLLLFFPLSHSRERFISWFIPELGLICVKFLCMLSGVKINFP